MSKGLVALDREYQYFEEPNPGVLKLFNLVGSGKKVLDVGCGFGELGEYLKKRNNYAVGIDLSQHAIDIAKTRLDEAYVCDITQVDQLSNLEKESFDLIIFADILEHLYNPFKVLNNFKSYLKPGGHVIVSLPNIAAWNIRLKLLFGKFDYQDTGILDKTHIRFFTKKTAKKMLESAGFEVEKIAVTPFFVRALLPVVRKFFMRSVNNKTNPRAIVDSKSYQFYLKYFYPIEDLVANINKKLFAFQFIFYARKR